MFAHDSLVTIDELAIAVAAALAAGSVENASGRVRAVPDVRTLRYYTSLGLLDRPAQLKGRTALYSRRHLLQLVAIKRLQAQGLSLAQVQSRLVNASDEELQRLAQLPGDFDKQSHSCSRSSNQEPQPVPSGSTAREPDRVFWKSPPRSAELEPSSVSVPDTSESSPAPRHRTLLGVPLAGDVSLLFQAVRSLDEQDLAALVAAAQPLLKTLRHRRILP